MYGQFEYEVGNSVQLYRGWPIYQIHWRGWLLRQENGITKRYAVYWLGPNWWDCVWEHQLHGIGQAPWETANYGRS